MRAQVERGELPRKVASQFLRELIRKVFVRDKVEVERGELLRQMASQHLQGLVRKVFVRDKVENRFNMIQRYPHELRLRSD